MASIGKMQLSGLRSFASAKEESSPIISFRPPLTIVVGRNGSGKTTLIEALKYVTTGDTPHGGLAAFIHDPLLTSSTDGAYPSRTTMPKTDGLVKLRFTDVQGTNIVATRRLQATYNHKTGKTNCKGEECVIQRTPANGEKITLSEKSANMNAEMSNLLGVSKAILNNVIFCHQEDSNWPLGEPKKVKMVFDEIFSADRYSAATDEMKKMIKVKKTEMTIATHGVLNAEKLLKQKRDREADLSKDEAKNAKWKTKLDVINEALAPLDENHKIISQRLSECQQIDTELATSRASLKFTTENIDRLRNNSLASVTILPTIEEVDEAMETVKKQAGGNVDQKGFERDIALLQGERKTLIGDEKVQNAEIGKLQAKVQMYESSIRERDDAITTMGAKYAVPCAVLNEFDEGMCGILQQRQQLARHSTTNAVLKSTLDKAADAKSKQSHMVDICVEEQSTNKKTMMEKKRQLDEIAGDSKQLTTLEKQAQSQDQLVAELTSEIEASGDHVELGKLTAEIADVRSALRSARDEYHMAVEREATSSKEKHLNDQLFEKENEMTALRRIHADDVARLMSDVSDNSDLLSVLNDKIEAVQRRIAERHSTLANQEAIVESKTKERADLKKALAKLSSDVAEADDRIEEVACGSADGIGEKVTELESEVSTLSAERDSLKGAKAVYERQTATLVKKHDCPICETHFSSDDQVQLLRQKMERMIVNIPSDCEQLQMKIDKATADMANLRIVQDVAREQERHKAEIAVNEAKLKSVVVEWTKAKKTVGELTAAKTEDANALVRLQRQLPAITQIADLCRAIAELRVKLDEFKRTNQSTIATVSASTIKANIDTLEAKESALDKKKTALVGRIESQRFKLADLSATAASTKEQLYALRSRMQDSHTMRAQVEELEVKIQSLREQEPTLRATLATMTSEYDRVLAEMKSADDEHAEKKAVLEKDVLDVKHDIQIIRHAIDKVGSIDTVTKQMPLVQRRLADIEARLTAIGVEETKLNERRSLAEHAQSRLRQLSDNGELLKSEAKAVELRTAIDEKESVAKHLDSAQLDAQRRKINTDMVQLNKQKNEITGGRQQLKDAIRDHKKALADPALVSAPAEHRDHLVTSALLKSTIEDLTKFILAIDHAIIEYHQEKMSEINSILRQLWDDVYVKSNMHGNDIEWIEIRAEASEGAETKRNTRAKYNYRVVMKCTDNRQEVDMRARCSAGQKVLASILIRIALAEVFGQNFGMLALDEPTTNLDKDKTISLAEALGQLVTARMDQSNFMLLVITHDENFVDVLQQSTGGITPRTYRVKRSEETNATDLIKEDD